MPGKDWIVTVWVPFAVRIENAEDEVSAKYITQDYLELKEPITGSPLTKLLDDATDPTAFSLAMKEGTMMSVEAAEDSATYPEAD